MLFRSIMMKNIINYHGNHFFTTFFIFFSSLISRIIDLDLLLLRVVLSNWLKPAYIWLFRVLTSCNRSLILDISGWANVLAFSWLIYKSFCWCFYLKILRTKSNWSWLSSCCPPMTLLEGIVVVVTIWAAVIPPFKEPACLLI